MLTGPSGVQNVNWFISGLELETPAQLGICKHIKRDAMSPYR
jgi:hypothetical protein